MPASTSTSPPRLERTAAPRGRVGPRRRLDLGAQGRRRPLLRDARARRVRSDRGRVFVCPPHEVPDAAPPDQRHDRVRVPARRPVPHRRRADPRRGRLGRRGDVEPDRGARHEPRLRRELGIIPSLRPDQLRGVILFCGVYDANSTARHHQPVPDAVLQLFVASVLWAYTGSRDRNSATLRQMSTIDHATPDFPPTFISGGNADPFTDAHSRPFATRLADLGVDVTTLFSARPHAGARPRIPVPHRERRRPGRAASTPRLHQPHRRFVGTKRSPLRTRAPNSGVAGHRIAAETLG